MSQPASRSRLPSTDLLRGAAAGLLASAATARVDALLDPLVGRRARLRTRLVRRGSPHEIAGPRLARRLVGRRLSRREQRLARAAFAVAYGVGWGVVHARVRRRFPASRRWLGLPFAVPFFALCDGVLAPRLGLTPPLHRVPWPVDAKELANHAAWTATAELAQRAAARLAP